MDKIDLWGNINNDSEFTTSILTLLEEQAKLLESKTDGIIKVNFIKIKYRYGKKADISPLLSSVTTALGTLQPLVSEIKVEEIDELSNLNSAGELYTQEKYKFEIYSSKYKFRLFTMDFKPVFPISVEVENGILSEKAVTKNVNSYQQMLDVLTLIFTSNKVRFIIHRMIELDKK